MEYQIQGEMMPVVICKLDAGETMITEKGSMAWMSPNMEMNTTAGGIGKAFGRMFSGESIFQNRYTAKGGSGLIAFASSFPGSVRAVEITPDKPLIVQKTAFLASTEGVELSVFFQKKMGAGFFGGEGFIMQKLSGRGMAFLEIDGHAVEYELAAGQKLVVDTGNLAMVDPTCSIDIQTVKGAKNMLFGGEGLFNLCLNGSGVFCIESQCPREELIEVELNNDMLKIDGNYAIAWSNSLDFTVERSGKTLIGSAASGEGLVNVYRGSGKGLMMPTAKMPNI